MRLISLPQVSFSHRPRISITSAGVGAREGMSAHPIGLYSRTLYQLFGGETAIKRREENRCGGYKKKQRGGRRKNGMRVMIV